MIDDMLNAKTRIRGFIATAQEDRRDIVEAAKQNRSISMSALEYIRVVQALKELFPSLSISAADRHKLRDYVLTDWEIKDILYIEAEENVSIEDAVGTYFGREWGLLKEGETACGGLLGVTKGITYENFNLGH